MARFITGLRVFSGIFAGVFKMPYRRFLVFNFSGAVVWAATMGWVGFVFGSNWGRLVHLVREIDWITLFVLVVVASIAGFIYRQRRRAAR